MPQRVEVHNANDGSVAIRMVEECLKKPCKCKHRVYKLIVMDMQMQQVHGDEATRKILQMVRDENACRIQNAVHRSQPSAKGKQRQNQERDLIVCNVVACTANTTDHWMKVAESSGMVQVLFKPMKKMHIR